MRFGRAATPVFHGDDYKFEIGKAEVIRPGRDLAFIATGIMVSEAMAAADMLAEQGISARVVNMPTIKPLDEKAVLDAAKECGKIVTVEEHNILGGLGEAVSGVVTEHVPVPVHRIGVRDKFGHSGSAAELLKQFGLCAENIAREAKTFLKG
jgi:transketolase